MTRWPIVLDQLAKRYSTRPSVIYNSLVEDMQIDLICYEAGTEEEESRRNKG